MRRFSLSDLALSRPVTVGMVLVAMFLLGIIATFRLPLAFLPSASPSKVRVRVNITRTSPEVLEREVIRPLEETVAGIRDLDAMRVSSGSWGVNLHLEFEPGTDIDARKLELRERLDRVRPDLPDTVQNLEISSSSGPADEPVLELRIASDKDLAREYYLLERRVVRPIERIPGVARVELSGVEPHELEVAVDLEAVDRNGVRLSEVGSAVRNAQQSRSLGILRANGQRAAELGVRSPAPRAEPEAFDRLPLPRVRFPTPAGETAEVPATQADETALAPSETSATEAEAGAAVAATPTPRGFARLGEVADVSLHPLEQRRGSRLNGRPAVNVEVFADAGASTVDVTREIRRTLDDLRGDPTLGGIDVLVFFDQGQIIVDTLQDLRDTGLYGGLIGLVVLFAFLHRWQTTLAAAVCIPLSVLAACGVLFLRGEELNCIVLLGLVLSVGMLIDNAVVIVESVQQQLQLGLSPAEAAKVGAREVGLATVASTMSSVIVFLPMVVGQGSNEIYTYMKPLGATFVTALVASLLVSQSVVPLSMGKLLRRAPKPTRNPGLERLANAYGALIDRSLRRPRLTLVLGALLVLPALGGLGYMTASGSGSGLQFRFGPQERQMSLPVRIEMKGSTDFRRAASHIKVMEDALLPQRERLGIDSITCRYRDWSGNCDIRPAVAIESEKEMSDFQAEISQALPEQPGVKYHVNSREHWHHDFDPRVVQFVIRGEDMGSLMELSKAMGDHLAERLPKGDPAHPELGGYDQIIGPYNEGNRELHVRLDGPRLKRLGLGASEVADLISMAFQGVPLGQVRGPDGEVTLRMSTDASDPIAKRAQERDLGERPGPGIAELEDLRVPLADGTEVPLSSLAEFEVQRAPWWVQRVDRQTEVRMQVRFFEPGEKNRMLVDRARAGFALPAGYSMGEGTQWWGDEGDLLEILIDLVLCLVLVYAVMASLFESFLQPLGILVTCLLGCVGAPWALWATGTTVDSVAMVGLFILIGIVVNNGIMLVDKTTQLRHQGEERGAALRMAGQKRLRPILMTASTTIVGLVPMLLHHPTLAGVYYHSIAIIVVAGLATSTITTLILLPSVYAVIEDVSLATRRVFRKFS